jgi:tRNA A-37 threonylcarbamoyl transferase component Bud32/membrane-associated phospholipid phosphatase
MSDGTLASDRSRGEAEPVTFDAAPVRRHRRPSGEPPPLPREWDRTGTYWLITLGAASIVWFATIGFEGPRVWFTEQDLDLMRPLLDHRTEGLTSFFLEAQRIGLHWLIPLVGWPAIAAMVVSRRWRHLLVFFASAIIVTAVSDLLAWSIQRPRPFGVELLGEWAGWAHPSTPTATLTAILVGSCAMVIPSGPWRRLGYIVTAVTIFVFGTAQVYLGVDHPTDVLLAVDLGSAVPLLLLRLFVPEAAFPVAYRKGRTAHLDVTGARAEAIREAVGSQLGLHVSGLRPVGLEGSAGSTPILLTIDNYEQHQLFGKIYARNHLRSDRWYKIGRELRYGRLEDENSFKSVRRLVQYEDYLLHLMRNGGIATAQPHGIVEITPDREYLILTDFLDGAEEIDKVELNDQIIDSALGAIRALWTSGLAHRDIKPANIMVKDQQVYLIDVAFGEVRPSPWREAVDLANMMLILALHSSPEHVLERARLLFTEAELAEAFAAARGITLPSQLRRQLREDSRSLLEEYRALLPERPRVKIQRWSWRRLLLTATVALLVAAVVSIVLANLDGIGLI